VPNPCQTIRRTGSKLLISRALCNGKTLAFQAKDAGSIPAARSKSHIKLALCSLSPGDCCQMRPMPGLKEPRDQRPTDRAETRHGKKVGPGGQDGARRVHRALHLRQSY
jgi:hypothetical protein